MMDSDMKIFEATGHKKQQLNRTRKLYFPVLLYLLCMQVLQLRLKLIIDWIIHKKQSISQLVTHRLPIFKAIRAFVEDYIRFMDDIVLLVEKIMEGRREIKNEAERTLMELFDLIRQKELVCIEEWKQKLLALDSKYNTGNAQKKPFPDIFKDIDNNIEYYTQLRTKLKKAIQKQLQNKRSSHEPAYRVKTEQKEKEKESNLFKPYADQRRRMDLYADIYDHQYANKDKRRGLEPVIRETGKIRTSPNQNSARNGQYSPFRLVNPKYSPYKEEKSKPVNRTFDFNYQSTKQPDTLDFRNDKYQQYKTELLKEVKREAEKPVQERPKYTAKKYLFADSPVKNYDLMDSREYSTAYTDRYVNSNRDQYWSDGKKNWEKERGHHNEEDLSRKGKQGPKKYKYLFEEDLYHPKTNPNFYSKGPKTEVPRFPMEQKRGLFDRTNEDSLEEDRLRAELEVDMPILFKDNENNLQELLASSLMESKRWNQSERNSQESQKDSLDYPERHIRETGRFKQLRYTDEDEPEPKRPSISKFNPNEPLTIEKQISCESRDLNMSFGRN